MGSMAIQGSIQNPQGMQVLPPGAIINPSSSANVSPIMIPPGSQGKIPVPWGWKRLLLSDKIVYFSPSGIQLKSPEEIKEYLFTEGTCKCGLDCPLAVDTAFDFNPQKISEMTLPNSVPIKNRGCKHVQDLRLGITTIPCLISQRRVRKRKLRRRRSHFLVCSYHKCWLPGRLRNKG